MTTVAELREGLYFEDGTCLYRVVAVGVDGQVLLENCWTNDAEVVPIDELDGLTPIAHGSNQKPRRATSAGARGAP